MRLARAIASLSYLSLLPGAAAFVSSAAAAMSSAAPHRAHDDATMDPVGSPLSPGGRPDGAIATFGSSTADRATDFANYFCAYAQLHHQKQMLTDHHRMAAYHAAIAGNPDVFKDKVVMDVGTGSGILAVWAAQAGARRVYAVEYTAMATHAQRVVDANGLGHIVKVIRGAVEEVELPAEDWEDAAHGGVGLAAEGLGEGGEDGTRDRRVVDVILSEWMGYFLLRESMLDSLVRARDRFLKPRTGLMLPSHAAMLVAPIADEDERRQQSSEYANAMEDWKEFAETTQTVYGVDMSVLEADFDREQHEYYILSSRWAELGTGCLLAEPQVVKEFDMHVCTLEDARGVGIDSGVPLDFDIVARSPGNGGTESGVAGPVSGFAGWFTVDFRSRTDEAGMGVAPEMANPSYLSTGPEMGYTHWGQQVFHLLSPLPLLAGQTTRLRGTLEMKRTEESARLYNVRFRYEASRRRTGADREDPGAVLMKGKKEELVYQIP